VFDPAPTRDGHRRDEEQGTQPIRSGWSSCKAGRVQDYSADGIVLVLSIGCVDGSIELEEHNCAVVTVLKHWSHVVYVLVNRRRSNLSRKLFRQNFAFNPLAN